MTNKELVCGFFMEGYVHHNYDFLMEHMAADYFDNSPCAARTNQECVKILKSTEKTFTDMAVEVLDLIEEGNKVAIRARFTATHSAEAWGYWPDMQIQALLMDP